MENVERHAVSVRIPADDTASQQGREETFPGRRDLHHGGMLRAAVLVCMIAGLANGEDTTGPSGTNLSEIAGGEADRNDLSRTTQREPGGANRTRADEIQAEVDKSQPHIKPHHGGSAREDPEITEHFDHRQAAEIKGPTVIYKRKGPYLPALGTEPYVRGLEVRGMGPGRPEQMPDGTVMKGELQNPWVYQTGRVRL